MKRKGRIGEEVVTGDPSLEDAARALTEFCLLAHMPPLRAPAKSLETTTAALLPPLPQWSRRRIRSCKVKTVVECSSNDDSHTTVSTNPLVQQLSECSSSAGKDSQSDSTLVKVEEPCSSEERRCPDDESERHTKIVSDCSTESPVSDSRADSPSSPLPTIQIEEITSVSLVPKYEDSIVAGRSAFQRVVPSRPIKKSAVVYHQPKVEEKFFECSNSEQLAAVKHISRKKPRLTGMLGHLASVKIEEAEADSLCTLALGPRGPPRVEETKRDEEPSSIIVPLPLVEVDLMKLGSSSVKEESRQQAGRLGHRGSGKLKPAISESEKEARRQRRVQANRESARQTIRRKQVLCEELSKKSQHLSAENEKFRKELELLRQKHKNLREMNSHLVDQVQIAKVSGSRSSPASASASPSAPPQAPVPSVGKAPGVVPFQLRALHFAGLPVPPPYVWAYAMAQAAQAAGIPPGEMTMPLGPEYASALAAAFGNTLPAGLWFGAGCPGQATQLPPFFPPQTRQAVASNLPPSTNETRTTFSPLMRSVSLPAVQAEPSLSLGACGTERTLASSTLSSYRSGDFSDSSRLSLDLNQNAAKRDTPYQASGGLGGKPHYFKLNLPSQTGMPSVVRSMPTRKSGEGTRLASATSAPGQLLVRSHSDGTAAAASHVPKMVNSRYSMYAPGGRRFPDMSLAQERPTLRESEAQRAAAKATEARRRRRELTRTKSLQFNRQANRLAEPSPS